MKKDTSDFFDLEACSFVAIPSSCLPNEALNSPNEPSSETELNELTPSIPSASN